MSDTNPLSEIGRAFDLVSQGLGAELNAIQVDLVDEGDAFVLYADVPGVDPVDVDVRISDGRDVTVAIESDREAKLADGEFVVRERHHRATSRTVSLPAPIEDEEAAASIDDGVLEVRLPKRTNDGDGTEIPVE